MSPSMRRKIFEVENVLIKKIDESKKKDSK
jgi:hypothetical protein